MNYPISFVIDKTAQDVLSYVRRLAAERDLHNDMLEYVIDKVLIEVQHSKLDDLVNASISCMNNAVHDNIEPESGDTDE